jgi:hypothetical protein
VKEWENSRLSHLLAGPDLEELEQVSRGRTDIVGITKE